MLEILNRYAHGFVTVPVVLALRKGQVFEVLRQSPLSSQALADRLNANSGHLRVALRLVESLGWLTVDEAGSYHPTPDLEFERRIPELFGELIDADMTAYLAGSEAALQPWIEQVRNRWGLADSPLFADFCDGLLVVPVLAIPTRLGYYGGTLDEALAHLAPAVSEEIITLFEALGWLQNSTPGSLALTGQGEFMVKRAMNLGVSESYRPMLKALDDLLFGDAVSIFSSDDEGHELHVDRGMNVISSGFQHDRYFADVDEIIRSIFSREPFGQQPRYVADMGSGDGTFLRHVFEMVRDQTPRGAVLDQYPLTMIGLDLNLASLEETSKTLGDIPHVVAEGDIGDPEAIVDRLKSLGISDLDEVMHIRSFLDHDRPFIAPTDVTELDSKSRANYLGVYVDRQGVDIPPSVAVQSLVEHLGRWSRVINRHGFLMLEVHCQDPQVVNNHIDASESLYFDALEGFSHQLLVEADVALMAAAECGLFASRSQSSKYPGVMPYCRITLNYFTQREFLVRLARPSDLPALLRLEEECWPEPMRISAEQLTRRMQSYALGQLVLELEGEVCAVVYSQRIGSVEELKNARFATIDQLHDPRGAVVQLLGLNTLPDKRHLGLGDQLLEFMLQRSSLQGGVRKVAGLTRCGRFAERSGITMADYIRECRDDGLLADPILRFHGSHGAEFVQPVADYRPEDSDNQGYGVLLQYDLGLGDVDDPAADAPLEDDLSPRERVGECLQRLLGDHSSASMDWHSPLMGLGLDSLGLLEFRTLLNRRFREDLDPSFFFQYPTPHDIAGYFEQRLGVTSAPAAEVLATKVAVSAGAGTEDVPIAVVGMACRFPGADSLEEYWHLLETGKDAITDIPGERWDANLYWNNGEDQAGAMVTRHGGFVGDVAGFDAAFFSISPREASLMDPQQRLLLELHWEALEHAGINPDALRETLASVYVGQYSHDYELLALRSPGVELGPHFSTGVAASISAGRIAYSLGLRGAAMTIDTACSSSLVAVHHGCRDLARGDASLVMASGVNLMLAPDLSIAFSRAGMLAPDGRCKTFDERADGYVRSEGAGVVVLKRLADAQRDGDRVYGLIRGSALNHDGASNGLTAPSVSAQEALLRSALADADLAPDQVDYLEAHGTGTALGDPVEYAALKAVFANRSRSRPLLLGSVKTQIGHTEAAAGMAGLIKTVLALTHQTLPPHLHFSAPNPHIDLDAIPAAIPTEAQPFEPSAEPLRAGISSFGFSGTNAHVIVEQAPPKVPVEGAVQGVRERPLHVLPLSARSQSGLAAQISRYLQLLDQPGISLADVCASAAAGRAQHGWRAAGIGASIDQIKASLSAALSPANPEPAGAGPHSASFMFAGFGAEYPGMGEDLYRQCPAFAAVMQQCDAALADRWPCSLSDLLYGSAADGLPTDESCAHPLNDPRYGVAATFGFEMALAASWQSWGVEPAAVTGFGSGEIAAACCAGALTLDQGLEVACCLGQVLADHGPAGRMAVVSASLAQVQQGLESAQGVTVAAINSDQQVVISGPEEGVQSVCQALNDSGIATQLLGVRMALHTPMPDYLLTAISNGLKGIDWATPHLTWFSSMSAAAQTPAQVAALDQSDYWQRQMQAPIRFADTFKAMLAARPDVMIEIGPRGGLIGMARMLGPTGTKLLSGGPRPGQSSWASLARSMAVLFEAGWPLQWRNYSGPAAGAAELPRYPWQRQPHWLPNEPALPAVSARGQETSIQGVPTRISVATQTNLRMWQHNVSAAAQPWLRGHRVNGDIWYPAAAYIAVAVDAVLDDGHGSGGTDQIQHLGLSLEQALVIDDDARHRLVVTLDSADDADTRVTISSSMDERHWETHVTGSVRDGGQVTTSELQPMDPGPLRARCKQTLSSEQHQAQMNAMGLHYSGPFLGLNAIALTDNAGVADLAPAAAFPLCRLSLHPAVIDCALQLAVALAAQNSADSETPWIPVDLEVTIAAGGGQSGPRSDGAAVTQAVCQTLEPQVMEPQAVDSAAEQQWCGRLQLLDADGQVVLEISRLVLRQVQPGGGQVGSDHLLHELIWEPVNLSADDQQTPIDLNQCADAATGAGLTEQLTDDSDTARQLAPELNQLACRYGLLALQTLGLNDATDTQAPLPELAATLKVVDQHQALLGRLVEMLVDSGTIAHGPMPLGAQPRLMAEELHQQWQQLAEAHPGCKTELTLLGRAGHSLSRVLRGQADPVEVLFPAGNSGDAETFYADSVFAREVSHRLARLLADLLGQAGPDRPLKILEIGAGTGGLTRHLLPVIDQSPVPVQYTFTDVGGYFLNQARERFADVPYLSFQVLDIERSALDQNVTQSFDVVIAANCLHATADLNVSLEHVKQLLAPGGSLLLLEGTRPAPWVDLIFGQLEGWWRFNGTDQRHGSPLISGDEWQRRLTEVGFSQAIAVPGWQSGRQPLFEQSVILAGRPQGHPLDDQRWLMLTDHSDLAEALEQRLTDVGVHCLVVDPQPLTTDLVIELLKEPVGGVQGVINLRPLASASSPLVTSEELARVQANICTEQLALTRAVISSQLAQQPALVTVTRNALVTGREIESLAMPATTLAGLCRVISLEHPELQSQHLDLDHCDSDSGAEFLSQCLSDAAQGSDRQLARRRSQVLAPRLVSGLNQGKYHPSLMPLPDVPAVLKASASDEGQVQWLPLSLPAPGDQQVQIEVRHSGMNFRDLWLTLGMNQGAGSDSGAGSSLGFGLELSGIVTAVGRAVTHVSVGDRVLAVTGDAHASLVNADAQLVRRAPTCLSDSEAAATPVAFLTAWATLVRAGKLSQGETVLVHAASGGVGLAAVQVARLLGAEVVATAGSPRKRAWLKAMGIAHVFDSRSLDFADQLLSALGGAKVDLVLNSLSGDFIPASLKTLGDRGRFIEIGKSGIWTSSQIAELRGDVDYQVVDLSADMVSQPQRVGEMLDEVLRGFDEGQLKALPVRRFAANRCKEALNFLRDARHIGKIVLSQPLSQVLPDAAQGALVVTGAFGGLGLQTARWLVAQGARQLMLLGRNEPTDEALSVIESLEEAGASVISRVVDVADTRAVDQALVAARDALGPIRGVYHLAGTLRDGVVARQQWQTFAPVIEAKVLGAWNLHLLTANDPLSEFVLFSSWSSMLGSPGQANHSAANAFLDALAWQRYSEGRPGLSVAWGAWEGAGAAQRESEGQAMERLARRGVGSFSPEQAFDALGRLMIRNDVAMVGAFPFDPERWRKSLQPGAPAAMVERLTGPDASHSATGAGRPADPARGQLRRVLATAVDDQDRGRQLSRQLCRWLGSVLELPDSDISLTLPFREMGLDSLTALEFRNLVSFGLDLDLPASVVWNYPSVERLADHLAEQLAQGSATVPDAGDDALDLLLDGLSDEEIAQALDQVTKTPPAS